MRAIIFIRKIQKNMQQIEQKHILELFKKYLVEGIVNISHTHSKDMEYNPLYNELSYDSSENISTSLTIIKNSRKSVYAIDGFSYEKLENAFGELLQIIDFAEQDSDIQVAQITDSVEKDFSNPDLEKIWFEYFKECFETVKNYPYNEMVKIEGFSMGLQSSTHYFFNSFWSQKIQKDNVVYASLVLFGDNWEKSEADWKSFSSKNILEITHKDIAEVEKIILDKLSSTDSTLPSQKYDIILDREVVIGFLDIIISNMSAEWMREGLSMFSKNKIWDQLFSPLFTLVNDPDLAWYTGTMLFDKEWVTAKKTVLFQEWKLTSKFYDYKNALKEGIENLGNSRVSNIDLQVTPTQNFGVGCRYLFTNLMAFHTVDNNTWKFSLAWEWYLLNEKWEKIQYVKNISLTWDIMNLFSSISGVGDDFKTDGNFRVPSLSFSGQMLV